MEGKGIKEKRNKTEGEQVQGKKHTKEKKPRLRLGFGVEREVISPEQDLLIFYLRPVP